LFLGREFLRCLLRGGAHRAPFVGSTTCGKRSGRCSHALMPSRAEGTRVHLRTRPTFSGATGSDDLEVRLLRSFAACPAAMDRKKPPFIESRLLSPSTSVEKFLVSSGRSPSTVESGRRRSLHGLGIADVRVHSLSVWCFVCPPRSKRFRGPVGQLEERERGTLRVGEPSGVPDRAADRCGDGSSSAVLGFLPDDLGILDPEV